MKNYSSISPNGNGTNGIKTLSHEIGTKDENTGRQSGLSILTAAIFITGEMAGSGVLALPQAIVNTGWIGLVLLIVLCVNAAYSGTKLGECWEIVEERYPQHRKETRNPYAVIASVALGKWGSYAVSHAIRLTLFGAGTVYLLLAAEIIQELLRNIFSLSSCAYFLIIAFCLAFPMWLGSPKDFSMVGTTATVTTAGACILFFLQMVIDGKNQTVRADHFQHGFYDFFIAFGTLLFAFGGASTFPTIQNDMHNKKQFKYSVIIAFLVILVLYLPMTIGGYLVYGESVQTNVALSVSHSTIVTVANILMAAHLTSAFLIVINPVCQDFEEALQIPKDFGWKRCTVRLIMMFLMIFVGESIPKFGKILSLVGGSTITLTTFVFPPLLYIKLCGQKGANWEPRIISLPEKVYLYELIFIGIFGGICTTYSAILNIVGHDTFTKPCYLK